MATPSLFPQFMKAQAGTVTNLSGTVLAENITAMLMEDLEATLEEDLEATLEGDLHAVLDDDNLEAELN